MSGNIPFDIQVEIITRLPVKSLIRFRSVCKTWKSLIDDSNFILNYNGQLQHLLVSYAHPVDYEEKYVSIVDNDTFPQHKLSLVPSLLVNNLKHSSSIISNSHGLFCFYDDFQGKAVIWNPSIRKAVAVVVPDVTDGYGMYQTVLGFGVCRQTNDPKILKITHIDSDSWKGDMESIPCPHVEVFALSTRAWRSPHSSSSNLHRKSIHFRWFKLVIDGALYMLASDTNIMDYNLIISFDITSEEFREINLPDRLAYKWIYNLAIFKLRESLVVLENHSSDLEYDIWMMGDGDPKSFTKLFSYNFNTPDSDSIVIRVGFKNKW